MIPIRMEGVEPSPNTRFVPKTKPAVSFKTTKSNIFTSMQSYDSLIIMKPELVEPEDGCESPPYRHHVPARCGKLKFVPELETGIVKLLCVTLRIEEVDDRVV